jgi:hypothetical protein
MEIVSFGNKIDNRIDLFFYREFCFLTDRSINNQPFVCFYMSEVIEIEFFTNIQP